MRSITKLIEPMTMSIPHNQTNAMTRRWQVIARLFVVLTGAVSALILLMGQSAATSLSSSAIAPDAFYTVSGVVSNSSTEPILGAEVTLLQPVGLEGSVEYAITTTNSQGAYQFGGVPTGIYYLRFATPNQCYFVQWYKQGTDRTDADPVIVNGGSRTGINITLTNGSCLTGTVRLDAENPAHDGTVRIYRQQNDASSIVDSVPIASNGAFYSHALTPGDYYLCAQSDHPLLRGCYGGEYLMQALAVTAPLTGLVTGIDFAIGANAFDGVISGTVTADGVAQPGIEVSLYNESKRLVYTLTGDDGAYHFAGLAAGAYRIGVSDPQGIYATMFYSKAISLLHADSLFLGSTEVISKLELSLVPAGQLAGTVPYYLSPPWRYAFLYWQPDEVNADSFWQWSGQACTPDAQDHFSFDNLPAGRYRLGFGDGCLYSDPDCAFFEYYGGTNLASAADIVVEAGQTTLVDANRDFAQKLFLPVIQR